MLIKNGRVYNSDTQTFENKDILIRDGKIAAIGSLELDSDTSEYDAHGARIIPGLVDVHTHGRIGLDFTDCNAHELHLLAYSYAAQGVTTLMSTVASAPMENMLAALARISEHVSYAGEANIAGVHLEGRYLNPEKRGAHASALLAPLDKDELEAFGIERFGAFHISAALELDADGSFIKKAQELGATTALGHTMASYAEARLAEERGIVSYTHLFNAMPPLHHRNGGAVCAALEGKTYVELICDRLHVCDEMIRLSYRMLGNTRCVLISDSISAAGMSDGEYSVAGNPAILKNGVARTPCGALAGSTLTLFDAMLNLMEVCSLTLEEAIPTATSNPAKMVGIYGACGSIDADKAADLVLLSDGERPKIEKVFTRGRLVE